MTYGSPTFSSWKHHLLHRTNNYPGTGYSFRLTVAWRPGMQRDFRDIRFSTVRGDVLGFFIESYTVGASASVWLKTGLVSDFYLHFGNGTVRSGSSGANAFLIYDDFSTNQIGTAYTEGHMTGASNYMPTHTVENGGYHCYNSSNADQDGGLLSNTTLTIATVAHVNCVYTSRLGNRTPPWVVVPCVGYGTNTSSSTGVHMGYWGSVQAGLNPSSPSDDLIIEWHNGSTSNNVKVWRGASLINTQSKDHSTHKKPYFAVRTASQERINCYFKSFFVRKYVATEPTASVISPVLSYNSEVAMMLWYDEANSANMPVPNVFMDAEYEGRLRDTSFRGSVHDRVYPEWSNYDTYRINDYPGEGVEFSFTVNWKLGMRGDFADLRFSDGRGNPLYYAVTDTTYKTSASVWVKAGKDATLNIFYGNAAATSESNWSKIFIFSEKFDKLDTNVWTQTLAGNGAATVSGGVVEFSSRSPNTNSGKWVTVNAVKATGVVLTYVYKAKYESSAYEAMKTGLRFNHWTYAWCYDYSDQNNLTKSEINSYVSSAPVDVVYSSDVRIDQIYTGTRAQLKVNGSQVADISYSAPSTASIELGAYGMGPNDYGKIYGQFKYITLTNYLATTPTLTVIKKDNYRIPPVVSNLIRSHSFSSHFDRGSDMFCLPQALGSWSGGFLRQSDSSVPICEVLGERTRSFARDALVSLPALNEDVQIGINASSEVPAIQSLSERLLAGLRQSDSSVASPEVLGERALTFARESLLSVHPVNEDVQTGVSAASSIPAVQSLSERIVSGLREASMTVDIAKALLEWSLAMARESAVSVPSVQGSAGFGIAASMSIPAPEMLFVAGNVLEREASASVSAVFSEAARHLIMGRGSDSFVQILQTLVEPEFTFGRTASASVPSPQISATFVYIRAEPNAPFFYTVLKRTYDADLNKLTFYVDLGKIQYYATLRDGETMYEITQYDSDTFTASLYDTDPLTNTRRLMPLSGYTVQAVLKGGIHETTITKTCTVLGAGSVTFSLDSADTVTPGMYSVKFLITDAGTGFRKEVPEILSEVQKIRINDKLSST